MLYKEPEELRDDTNNNCKGHYNRNTLLAIIVQLRYPGVPLNSLLGGLSDDLKNKHWMKIYKTNLQILKRVKAVKKKVTKGKKNVILVNVILEKGLTI